MNSKELDYLHFVPFSNELSLYLYWGGSQAFHPYLKCEMPVGLFGNLHDRKQVVLVL